MNSPKQYGILVCDPYFPEYVRKHYKKQMESAYRITLYHPHITCSIFKIIKWLGSSSIVIIPPSVSYCNMLNAIRNEFEHVVSELSTLFDNMSKVDNKKKWYAELDTSNEINYMFLIMHRPTFDYQNKHAKFDIDELVRDSVHINKTEMIDHIRSIHMLDINVANALRQTHLHHPHMWEYSVECEIISICHRDNEQILFTSNDQIYSDLVCNTLTKHSQKIQTGYVFDSLDYCDKWDIAELEDNFDNINTTDLTINGCILDEKLHPQLADDPVFSPMLRTLEFRKQCIESSKPNMSYSKLAEIALSLGITHVQNGKRLKKNELYYTIQAIPI